MTDRASERRRALKRQHAALHAAVSKTLQSTDPLGLIELGAPDDEYEPEVGTIMPRLGGTLTVEDAQRVIHEEFVAWFGLDTAGPLKHYESVAAAVWRAWTDVGAAAGR